MGFQHHADLLLWNPFFFENVLKKDWHLLKIVKAKRDKTLPTVLTLEEVQRIFSKVKLPHYLAYLYTTYSCGLRLSEGLNIQVSDIDSQRMQIHIHRGKGAKDRIIPLPETTLRTLKKHWVSHRHPFFLFPAMKPKPAGTTIKQAKTHLNKSSVQDAFQQAKKAACIHKRNVSVHTLRHSYATHLLEAGVNIRAIQRYMGHAHLETTMIYLHLTQKGQEDSCLRINQVMAEVTNELN